MLIYNHYTAYCTIMKKSKMNLNIKLRSYYYKNQIFILLLLHTTTKIIFYFYFLIDML